MAEEEKKEEVVEETPEEKEEETSEEAKEEAPADDAPKDDSSDDTPKKDETKEEVKEEEPEMSADMEELAKKYEGLISEIEKLTALELADLVKVLEAKFGVSAAGPAAAAAAGPGEEKTEFNVLLKASGEQKINAIKAVREITGLGLKEAKDLVEAAPKVIKESVKKAEAEEMVAKLKEAGAIAELE